VIYGAAASRDLQGYRLVLPATYHSTRGRATGADGICCTQPFPHQRRHRSNNDPQLGMPAGEGAGRAVGIPQVLETVYGAAGMID
jgi:hypothetical protein